MAELAAVLHDSFPLPPSSHSFLFPIPTASLPIPPSPIHALALGILVSLLDFEFPNLVFPSNISVFPVECPEIIGQVFSKSREAFL